MVTRIWTADTGDPAAGQPRRWTFLEFRVPDRDLDLLGEDLRSALARGPWYCDLRSEGETVVVFADRAFRYERGDRAPGPRQRRTRVTLVCLSPDRLAGVNWMSPFARHRVPLADLPSTSGPRTALADPLRG